MVQRGTTAHPMQPQSKERVTQSDTQSGTPREEFRKTPTWKVDYPHAIYSDVNARGQNGTQSTDMVLLTPLCYEVV